MKTHFLKREQLLDLNIKDVFAFFERPENLELKPIFDYSADVIKKYLTG